MTNFIKKIKTYYIFIGLFMAHVESLSASEPVFTNGIATWQEPNTIPNSTYFSLKVQNTTVQVTDWTTTSVIAGTQTPQVARFATTGAWTAVITANETVNTVVIRPKSKNIAFTKSGNTLTLTVNSPEKLYIQINSLPIFCVFAMPKQASPVAGATIIPAGVTTQDIALTNGQTLWLDAGAVLKGHITGTNVSNIRIAGYGILDDIGTASGNAINLTNCTTVTVEGLFIRHAVGAWSVLNKDCSYLTYRNICLLSFEQNNDGIDCNRSSNVLYESCFIRAVDDCIAIKNFPAGKTVTNIQVKNCTLYGYINGDGFTIGHETLGPINNITVSDCDIIGAIGSGNSPSRRHSALSIIDDGVGPISNITFDNIRIEDLNTANNLELGIKSGAAYGNGITGKINNITVKNINWTSNQPVHVLGYDATHLVENVTFQNCTLAGRQLTATDVQYKKNTFINNILFDPSVPVELTAFSAQKKQSNILIKWATASQYNTENFDIERSIDGKIFSKIGQIKALGISHNLTDYEFLDTNIPLSISSVFYYRLTINDLDGTSKTTDTRSVQFEKTSLSVDVFPNPSKDGKTVLIFNGGLNEKITTEITIKDLYGRQIFNTSTFLQANVPMKIQLYNAVSGIYFLMIKNGTKWLVQKWLVE